MPLGPVPSGASSRSSLPSWLDKYTLHRPGVSVRLPATSIVQIPSSVHCIPLADRPGALKRCSILPAGRLGYPALGAAGVFAWPAAALAGHSVATMTPPAAAAA